MRSIWSQYGKKLTEKILNPRNAGFFSQEERERSGLRLVVGREGFPRDGHAVALFWLVDESDGIIVDAKFQLFGDSSLIAACEEACLLSVGKNWDQAKRISADLIDRQLRDHPESEAFPEKCRPYLNLVIDAIDDAVEQCSDLPLPKSYVSPVPKAIDGEGYPNFETLSKEQQLAVIEEIIQEEIRPYIELDAGGIEIAAFEGMELTITYQGSCTSCFSAVGATLSTIQEIMAAKVHPDLKVVPDLEALQL